MARRIKSYMEIMFSHVGSVFSATFKEERIQIAVTGGPMKGKVALVTGANGGLGTYVTQALLDAGGTVIGLARTIAQSEFNSTNFTALPADISTADGAKRAVDSLVSRFGRLDILVHTVGGFAGGKPLAQHDDALFERRFA